MELMPLTAADLSPAKAIEPKYQCSLCDKIHEDEWDAEDCCKPDVYKIWVCPVCDETHYSMEDAIECCELSEEEIPEDFYIFPKVHDPASYIRMFHEMNHLIP